MKTDIIAYFSKLQHEDEISAIDLEFCRFLQEIDLDIDNSVLLAACLTSAAYQNGNICITLDEYADQRAFKKIPEFKHVQLPFADEWRSLLLKSSVVGEPDAFKPLILDQSNRLYLHKLWHYEQNLIRKIMDRIERTPPEINRELLSDGIGRLFDKTEGVDWQKVAAIAAVRNLFTVISGGPGTGKTTTVVRLLALLIEQGLHRGALPAIALAAPTGKAAGRLEQSIRESIDALPVSDKVKQAIPVEAVTLHQLLGARRDSASFRYNKENLLPYDTVIVDEVSMVDQGMMSRLMDALLPNSRLLLLGDKDQLASVEAGSILGDICGDAHSNAISEEMRIYLQGFDISVPENSTADEHRVLNDHIILLQKSYRFGTKSGIGRLAGAINSGAADEALKLLADDGFEDISIRSFDEYEPFEHALFERIKNQFNRVQRAGTVAEKLSIYREFKILAAHRSGPWGVQYINSRLEQHLQEQGIISPYDKWYQGRPVIIKRNDYSVGLSNGDIGICLVEDGRTVVCFEGDEGIIRLSTSRLPAHACAYAMTVHKSQGSEFDRVCLVLPDRVSSVMSRELLYTAITRARSSVDIFGDAHTLTQTIQKKIARNSGLKDYFWK